MLKAAATAWLAQRRRAVKLRLPLLLACLACAAFEAQAQMVAAPVFSVAGGSYTTAQSVVITDATAGAAIYYTTNGSTPSTKSFLYGGPIPVHENLTINALAVFPGGGQSAVATAAYAVSGVTTSIATIAGTGVAGYSGDGGPAATAQLNTPTHIAFDRSGQIYIADSQNNVVRKISTSGIMTTFAGTGAAGFSGDGGPATSAMLATPNGVAVAPDGDVYISDRGNLRIRKVLPNGIIITFAGNGTFPTSTGDIGDGGPATNAELSSPNGLLLDTGGDLLIADSGSDDRVRRVTPQGIITTVAGNGVSGFSGDGGPAVDAQLNDPVGLAFNAAGDLYIAEFLNCRIRMVDVAGIISTFAGNGVSCGDINVSAIGDGGPATSAELTGPTDVAVDAAGFVYESEFLNRVRAISSVGIIETLAGDGVGGFNGDGAPASNYTLDYPEGVATDGNGNVYVGDQGNQRVREVTFTDAAAQPTAAFGTMQFSPAAAVLQNTSEAVTISDTLAYTGAPPTGAVAYVLNGVTYAAVCTGSASPRTCSATVPPATIAALPPTSYTVTGSFAGDANYAPATAASGTFNVDAAGACMIAAPGNGSMNIVYYTVSETDQDAASLGSGESSDYVLPGLGPNGLPVYNSNSTATGGTLLSPHDLLSDGEISWWSPALNNGGPGGTSDVVYTGPGVAPLPYVNDFFYPPNGAGPNDQNGFQAAVLTGNLVLPTPQAVTFTISSDDMAFVYLDGQIACDDGGVHGPFSVPCTTSVLFAGTHTMQVFYVDLHQTGAVLEFSVSATNVSVGTINPVVFGPVAISPSATVTYGTNQPIALSDTLTYPGPQPAGAVSFVLNGVSYTASCTAGGSPETCTATIPGATIAALAGGNYAISASFAGDCNYAAATSGNAPFDITAASTTTELAASATLLSFGQSLNLAATVSSAGPVSGGTVSFYNRKTLLNSASLGANGVATLSVRLPVGSYSLTATYSGSADGLPSSSSPPVAVTVVPAASSTTLISSLNPAAAGSAVAFAISVQSPAGAPTGSVTLSEGATVLAVLPLSAAASATYTTSSLFVGPHDLTATYTANGNFAASQGTLTQIILPPPTFTIAASAPLRLVTQHHGAVTITVTPVDGFSGPVTLSCGALPQWATCEWGGAAFSSTLLPVDAGPASTQVVVDTSAVLGYESSARGELLRGNRLLLAGLALPALLLLSPRKKKLRWIALCVLALIPAVSLSGCSGMLPDSTLPGTYSIPLLGTSGNIQSSGTLTLIVTE